MTIALPETRAVASVARPPQFLTNRETGERIAFLRRESRDGVACAVFDFRLAPGGAVPVEHMHAEQTERYVVERGTMTFSIDGAARTLSAGESIDILPGQFHTVRNAGDDEAAATVTFTPADGIEHFFESLFGLANEGKTKAGAPSLLQVAAFIPQYRQYIAGPPVVAQRILFFFLGPIARLLGYRKTFPEYRAWTRG